MNANSNVIELFAERSQVEEAILSLFHTILLHRSTGKFDYKQEKTYSIGTVGTEDVDCEFIDFTFVRIASRTLDAILRKHISAFRDQLQEASHNGVSIGTITLEFYQKRPAQWRLLEKRTPWEIWNIQVTERSLYGEVEKTIVKETTASKLAEKITSIVETIGRHDFVPKMPEMIDLPDVFDTSFTDIQPYLFNVYYNCGSATNISNNTVGSAVRRLLHEYNSA